MLSRIRICAKRFRPSNVVSRSVLQPYSTHWPRTFSSNPAVKVDLEDKTGVEKEPLMDRIKKKVEEKTPTIKTYSVVGGCAVGAYYSAQVGLTAIHFLQETNAYPSPESLLSVGVMTSISAYAFLRLCHYMLRLDPEVGYQLAVNRVCTHHNSVLRDELGDDLKVSPFRACSFEDGDFRVRHEAHVKSYDGWQRVWRPRKINVVFHLEGTKKNAMVSAGLEHDHTATLRFKNLIVTVLPEGRRIVLEGDKKFEEGAFHEL